MAVTKEKALSYHAQGKKGKLSILPTKPCRTVDDLSLAYTPGVAYPCLEIKERPADAYNYTAKGNLVAVISNGTAVLGLGNIGALAGKPVMEGKSVLFKRFAGIDAFDIEITVTDPQKVVDIVAALEPTFGGINLEDIKAPDCFFIEQELIKRMKIPVFHDDQHGTAVIASAALLNATDIAGKKVGAIKIVFSGAGSAAIAIAHLFLQLGIRKEQIWMVDTQGIISKKRQEKNPYKAFFAQETAQRTLADALAGADVFIGVSQANLLTGSMLQTMRPKPIVFAMANPVPEISYEEATAAVPDIIMATGRSDYPNQVNNVLGFPFIFRGALDVRATVVNTEMKLAAVQALSKLARLKVPAAVVKAYGKSFTFGVQYILPKPFDPRVLSAVAPAVAQAAMATGVARKKIVDMAAYKKDLQRLAKQLAKGKF